MTRETSEMNPSPSELDPAKLATTSIEKVRSTRAMLVDRFEEELTIAVIEGVSTDTTTAIFLLDVELVALKIWDSTPAIMPTLVAEAIIESVIGLGDTISCSVVGSGSFVGFAHSLSGSSAVEDLAEQIRELFNGPIELDGILHHADVRIGASEVSKAAKSAGQALEQARMALLETSKELPAVVFSSSLERRRRYDEGLEYDLKLALTGGQIDVVFQPIVSLKENRISGVEAFARWTHPEHGEILPPQFLTIAERSGIIRQLGEQVLVKAMKAADLWAQHECLTNIVLWVNFSPTEIAYPDFEPMIKNLIQQYPRVQLGLELAESSVMEERIISTTLRHLRSYGVRTSVDDFSSKDTAVARLRTLPFDNVKIGRDLIRSLSSNDDDQAIVQLLSELGSRSDFTVSAVGVETEEELALLRELGVDCAQGYLLARPATDAEVGALLEATLTA